MQAQVGAQIQAPVQAQIQVPSPPRMPGASPRHIPPRFAPRTPTMTRLRFGPTVSLTAPAVRWPGARRWQGPIHPRKALFFSLSKRFDKTSKLPGRKPSSTSTRPARCGPAARSCAPPSSLDGLLIAFQSFDPRRTSASSMKFRQRPRQRPRSTLLLACLATRIIDRTISCGRVAKVPRTCAIGVGTAPERARRTR